MYDQIIIHSLRSNQQKVKIILKQIEELSEIYGFRYLKI